MLVLKKLWLTKTLMIDRYGALNFWMVIRKEGKDIIFVMLPSESKVDG